MANPYKRLIELLPTTPRQVGEVTGVRGSKVEVSIVGGGTCYCQGSYAVGSMVYIEGDVVIGEAPSLPVEMIEV